jgi:uncharacterized membrane protein YhaH (DUF805 family)
VSDPGAWSQVPQPGVPGPAPTGPAPEPALDRPWYGATFRGAIRRFWKKYATFTGRASRSEFWWWQLAAAIVGVAINLVYQPLLLVQLVRYQEQLMRSPDSFPTNPFAIYGQLFASPAVVVVLAIGGAWWLATIVPTLALGARRLHDIDLSGWLVMLYLVPGAYIALFVLAVFESKPRGARFDSRVAS